MDEEQQDVCAICLDPYLHMYPGKNGTNSLLLACGHEYHAGCLLLSYRKQSVDEWKCPLCRDKVVRRGVLDFQRDQHAVLYTSRWESLQSFLNKATISLNKELSGKDSEARIDALGFTWVSACLDIAFKYLPSSFDHACVTICGRYRLQCLLDPRKEPFSTLVCRHLFSILGSLVVLFSSAWFVKWFCVTSIGWVCPVGTLVLAKVLPPWKQRSLEQATCFIKISSLANYIHSFSYGLISIMLLIQINRTLRRHILHEWPSISIQVNAGLIILAVLYAFTLFVIRLSFHIKFGFDEIMSGS